MKDRVEFTAQIAFLLQQMAANGERPVADYVLRSKEEQQRLFSLGRVNNGGQWQVIDSSKVVTKCDGITNPSKHQSAMAMDIYFIDANGKMDFNKDRYLKWHTIWQNMGGRPVIEFDLPHFEAGKE